MKTIMHAAAVLLAAWLLISPGADIPAASLAAAQDQLSNSGAPYTGLLRAFVTDEATGRPVGNATVSVQEAALSVHADEQGATPVMSLSAPDPAYSFQPDGPQFFAEYTVDVDAEGYRPVRYRGVRIIAGEETDLYAPLAPLPGGDLGAAGQAQAREEVTIPEHALWSARRTREGSDQVIPQSDLLEAPPARAESDGLSGAFEAGGTVRAAETPPATIVVHRGDPADPSAPNITVNFEEYVKGVLPSEWIPSWPRDSLLSGALAIRSYAMYVVRTGKWRSRGYAFDIVSTSLDQVWNPNLRCPSTDSAVDATAGQYIAYNGLAINAQYRAHTGSPTDDWYRKYQSPPYLQGILDQVEADHGYNYTIGPGMSQWGSKWWAEPPYNHGYEWIVKHYYTGVGLLQAATTLLVSSTSVSFLSLLAGSGGTTETGTITISDNAGRGVPWAAVATSDRGWLTTQASSGQTPASLAITATPVVNGSPLPKGIYQGTITISAPGTANPVTTIPVSYVLTDRIYHTRLAVVFKGASGW